MLAFKDTLVSPKQALTLLLGSFQPGGHRGCTNTHNYKHSHSCAGAEGHERGTVGSRAGLHPTVREGISEEVSFKLGLKDA